MIKKPKIEVVIPIYNEQEELEGSVETLYSFLHKHASSFSYTIYIADNASNDNSAIIAKKLVQRHKEIQYIHFEQKGRGRAVKSVWTNNPADYYIYMDVDLSTDLKHLPSLITALQDGYDIAIGSRLLPKSKVVNRTAKREIISRSYNLLIKLFFQTAFSDAQCGFKAVNHKVVQQLIPEIADDAWFFDSELLIIAEKSGYRIHEEAVKWIDNPGSTVRVLNTASGDLKGLWRLFITRPWNRIKKHLREHNEK